MRISAPTYTQTPNDLFDHWLPLLKEVELKVLLVIMRKTFGWHKPHDYISISQIQKMTGSSATNVLNSIKSLIGYGLVKKEVSGPVGQQKTTYSLIVNEDSNNFYPCQDDSPPLIIKQETPAKKSVTKETILKETKKKIEQQQPAAASSKFYKCLESVNISLRDKIEITQNHLEAAVKSAIAWATHPQTKIKTTLVQAIKWACDANPMVPTDELEENKAYAKKQEARYPNGITVECLSKHIEIVCTQSRKTPNCIEYTEKGFKEQLDNALRKSNITPK